MSTLADAMLAWKAKLTTKVTPEQVLTLRSDVNVFVDGVRFLESENAKLRELCRDVFAHEAIDCERCAYGERCKAHETTCYTAGIIIRKRARELGVDDV